LEYRFVQEILDAVPSGVVACAPDGRIQAVNPPALALLDCDLQDALNKNVSVFFPPDGPFDVSEIRMSPQCRERTLLTSNGEARSVLINSVALRDGKDIKAVICSLVDRQEARDPDVDPSHAQQLQSVGRITAGIAHEINTPVQFIGDSVTFLQEAFEDLSSLQQRYRELLNAAESGSVNKDLITVVREAESYADLEFLEAEIPTSLKRTLEGVSRVAEITRAIKEFSYPDQKEKVAVDLNAALMNTLIVARNEYKYVADLETDLGDLPPVFCHIGHLNQVFLNLVINAAHAISEVDAGDSRKGTIQVSTRSEGNTVRISIRDTGCGIPEEIREQIYDSFFTTKEFGKGTGQGLAIARSIVTEKHFGTLDLETEVGKGTSFLIRLPVDGETRLDPETRQ
jgi:signal transduction histidine kinase